MTVFLTSSPCIQGIERPLLTSANGFLDRIAAVLPPMPRCLFMCSDPNSPERTDRFAKDMLSAFSEAGMSFGQFGILDGRNAVEAEFLIGNSDFIILAGGHVPTQNAFFQEIRLASLLEGYSGVIMGISAGSMNAASIVYAQPELNGESIDPAFQRFLPGLGLTRIQILPHYQQICDWMLDGKRLFEDITYQDSIGHCFYALVDGSYLLINESGQRLFGECYRICDGAITQLCRENESIRL